MYDKLAEVCAYLNNYFSEDTDKYFGEFEIKQIHEKGNDGMSYITETVITQLSGHPTMPPGITDKGYFRIIGSKLNDGVYTSEFGASPEVFEGAIWIMHLPHEFLSLVAEISTYARSDVAMPSAYSSESFGGYSYTRLTDKNGAPVSWQKIFADRLKLYRRMRT